MVSNPPVATPARALVIVAHPDDAEFMAAGTVAAWAREGAEVAYCIVTRGDKGSDDQEMTPARLTVIREAEQRAAAHVLGVRECMFLGYPDGYLEPTLELRRDLTRIIRQVRPEAVITFDPTMRFVGDRYLNHPDHRATGDAALDAIFPSARDRLTFPELLMDGYEPHKVRDIYLGFTDAPNHHVDVTATLAAKQEALRCHPSQVGEDITQFAEQMARMAAAGQPFAMAEAFRLIRLDQAPPMAEAAEAL